MSNAASQRGKRRIIVVDVYDWVEDESWLDLHRVGFDCFELG